MTYLVTESCIKCKYMDCVEVCEPECPVEAIIPDTIEDDPRWLEVNTKFAEIWPNITTKGKVDTSVSDSYAEEKGKFEKYFSEKGGDES